MRGGGGGRGRAFSWLGLLASLTLLACSSKDASHPDGGAPGSGGAIGGDGAGAGAGGSILVTDGGPWAGDAGNPDGDPPGIFVAVGSAGRTIRSIDDGLTWIDDVSRAAVATDPNGIRTVGWGNQEFLALGWSAMTSADGKDWQDFGMVMGNWVGAVVYAQGIYVGVGGNGLRGTSPDGMTWQDHHIDFVATHSGRGLVFGDVDGGRFVSANDNGQRTYSNDGASWIAGSGAAATRTTLLAFGNGIFVGIDGANVVSSSDGKTWSDIGALGASCSGLLFAQGHFTAVGNNRVFASADGRTWSAASASGMLGSVSGLAYGHGTYVLVDSVGGLSRSTDAVTWRQVSPATAQGFLSWVAFGPTP
jgi:hypothetical protein